MKYTEKSSPDSWLASP